MAKRILTEESCTNFRDKKRVRVSPVVGTSHGFSEFCFSDDGDDRYDKEECDSSVGSNTPIFEVVVLSDEEDDDEVESPLSKSDTSSHEQVTGNELQSQETKSEISLFRRQAVVENQSGEIRLMEKKWGECTDEELEIWWVEFGSKIVDDNGFLLGDYRKLDEELYISIT